MYYANSCQPKNQSRQQIAVPFFQAIDKIMDDAFNINLGSDFANKQPKFNIVETPKSFLVELAAPGLEKSDFQISLDTDQLVIKAEKQITREEGETYKRRGFDYTRFEKRFTLHETIDQEAISAQYNNGVLVVTLPKKEVQTTVTNKTISIL